MITKPINRAPDHRDFVWQSGLGKKFEFRKMTGEHNRINHFQIEIPPGNKTKIPSLIGYKHRAELKRQFIVLYIVQYDK